MLLDAAVLTGCRHRVHLDNSGLPPAGAPDLGVLQRRAEAAQHRLKVGAVLADDAASWTEIPSELPARTRAELTMQAVAAGVDRIWGAVLPDDVVHGRRGRVELLLRDGDGYLPVLVVNHRTTDPGTGARTTGLHTWQPGVDTTRSPRSHPRDQLRLAHLTRMLQEAGIAGQRQLGGVIGLDADCIVVHDLSVPSWPQGRSTLEVYDERFADRRAVAAGTLATGPSRIGECRTCRWWPRCGPELLDAHDVSLVVRGTQVEVLRELDASTVDKLAAWEGPEPSRWSGGSFADAVVLARAWLRGAPLVRREQEVRVRRADVEVDVDMESYLEHGAYLWGTLLTGPGVEPVYRGFATWDPLPTPDEGRSFAEFWTWLMAARAEAAEQGRTFAAYCYSEAAENRWLLASARRFAGMAGIPATEQVREFIDSEQWVDVYAAVGAAFLCPLGKGLKKVAPVAGFSWRDPEAGGEASMGWYRVAVGMDGGVPDMVQRQRLLDYNADDVWATKILREWMDSPAVREVPLASEL